MPTEERHLGLPQLYGAPAYARPPTVVSTSERPFDPDGLPIEALRTDEEREVTATLPARTDAHDGVTLGGGGQTTSATGGGGQTTSATDDDGRRHAFRLRSITGRLLGGD